MGPLLALPALAPMAAKALPWVASIAGSMLPVIVDAFRSGRSPEEARQIVEPKRQEIIDRLIGTGMNRQAAEAMADESIKGEFAQAQLPEPMNPWLTAALSIGGAVGGYKLGAMGAKRMGGPKAAPEQEVAASKVGDTDDVRPALPAPKTVDVEAEVMQRGPFPGRSPAPPPEMSSAYRTEWTSDAPFPSPGVMRGRGFTMRGAEDMRLGMGPEITNQLERERMAGRLYRYEGG